MIECAFAQPGVQFIVGPTAELNRQVVPLFNGNAVGGPAKLFAVDITGTGRPDVLVAFGVGPPAPSQKIPLVVLRAGSGGVLSDATQQVFGTGTPPGTEAPREIVMGDFNRDGRPDLFVADHGYDAPPFPGSTNLLLLSSANGTLTNNAATLTTVPDFTHSATVADIDGDGYLDIFVGNLPSPVPPYFLLGQGNGNFIAANDRLPADILNPGPGGNAYATSLLVDLDGDGFPDLVLGTGQGATTPQNIVLFNDGHGDFTKRPRYVLPGALGTSVAMVGIAALDVNRDGFPDLVMVGADYSLGSYLRLLVNQRDGRFADETVARMGAAAAALSPAPFASIHIADLNGDGAPDIYGGGDLQGATIGSSIDMIWLNDGHGIFAPVSSSALGPGLGPLVAVDIDGDGRLDFVAVTVNPTTGKMAYRTFLNRTVAVVPGDPVVTNVAPGNTVATLTFIPPGSNGGSPITGYRATCTAGASVFFNSGTFSPITVGGLINDTAYACSVTASSAIGIGTPSTPVSVTPSSGAAIALVAVQSRKVHSGAGLFDLQINPGVPIASLVSVEPRIQGATNQIVFQFNNTVNSPGTATVTDANLALIGNATTSKFANEVIVTFAAVPDNKRVHVELAGVNSLLAASASLGFLIGDTNGSRSVNASDISGLKARLGQSTNATNFMLDLNGSGGISAADLSMVKARSGTGLQ